MMCPQPTEKFKQALEKARYLCSRQEKCRHEILEKLKGQGLEEEEAEEAAGLLEKEGFIDDSRYALAFARDKSRLHRWGKMKIRNALYLRHISPVIIEQALDQLEETEYTSSLRHEMEKKLSRIKGKNLMDIKAKLFRFAIGKGYEPNQVYKLMDELLEKKHRKE
jgi:regulatory protein